MSNIRPEDQALLTDLYRLTMAIGNYQNGPDDG
jgi:hypothetical protein